MEFLFGNIGGKIKGLVAASSIIGAIGSFVGGIAFAAMDVDFIIWGILMTFLGPIFAWIFSWTLYGFGEIICNLEDINLSTKKHQQTNPNHQHVPTSSPQNDMVTDYCPECNAKLRYNRHSKRITCPNCKSTLEVSG